jgi:hypothetical protein
MEDSAVHRTMCRILPVSYVIALTVAMAATVPQQTDAQGRTPPAVPDNIEVPAGNKVFHAGHAIGTQNYICLPSGPSVAWTLVGPQATLFNEGFHQVMTHFLSPNPDEIGTARATWQDSVDSSAAWGRAVASSSDPAFVARGAIPWLLLESVGVQEGPRGSGKLTATTFIQRLNTLGGIAPSTGCAVFGDVGQRAFVPYEADYYFYRARRGADD